MTTKRSADNRATRYAIDFGGRQGWGGETKKKGSKNQSPHLKRLKIRRKKKSKKKNLLSQRNWKRKEDRAVCRSKIRGVVKKRVTRGDGGIYL